MRSRKPCPGPAPPDGLGLGLIGRPEVLFLDEPTTGLDPEARRRLWAVIGDLAGSGGTVLLTTHYLEEAQHMAARVMVLADGKVVPDATPDQIRTQGIGRSLLASAPASPNPVPGLDTTAAAVTGARAPRAQHLARYPP